MQSLPQHLLAIDNQEPNLSELFAVLWPRDSLSSGAQTSSRHRSPSLPGIPCPPFLLNSSPLLSLMLRDVLSHATLFKWLSIASHGYCLSWLFPLSWSAPKFFESSTVSRPCNHTLSLNQSAAHRKHMFALSPPSPNSFSLIERMLCLIKLVHSETTTKINDPIKRQLLTGNVFIA